ncbi:D-alanyl-D-alanine carboxypeptidase/D-alanyl-D-alanine-endopeptidase [Actinosynnema sp. NPDC020468]|uniref:D-alanyl-D-alanine carboxypeptidase/D-alanyl-D-alanine endopeptidase n=1 Tax=Actinosynnema sp. NPDC020468 TaxID=3154488 RepID=UPI0033DB5B45
MDDQRRPGQPGEWRGGPPTGPQAAVEEQRRSVPGESRGGPGTGPQPAVGERRGPVGDGPTVAVSRDAVSREAAGQRRVAESATVPTRAELPPKAAPARIEPAEVPEEPAPRRRKKKTVLVVVVVLVLALGGAAAFGGFRYGWFDLTPTATTAAPAPPAPVAMSLKGVSPDAPAPTAAGVAAVLQGPAAAGVLNPLSGIVLDPTTGTALWQQGDTTPFTPASTIKILTSAAALLSLDHTAQFSTKVVAGDKPGTAVIVGGGDPTLSSLPAGQTTVYPGAATVDDLVAQVKASGAVTEVGYDTSRYAGDGLAPGWDPGDVAGGYVTPITPLIMDGGRLAPKEIDTPRTATPAADTAKAVAQRLGATAGGEVKAAAGAKVLGEVKSAPVDRLVENLMQISDNVLAEAMAREVAKSQGLEVSFAGGAQAVEKVLTANGFDLTGVAIVDGSGLSPTDKVPAKLLAQILSAAASPNVDDPKTAKLRPLLTALPVAGGSGTLAGRYADSDGRGWVRAKTGTLTGVNSLAGVVVDGDGRLLVFAFMSLSAQSATDVRGALDTLAAALRGCGCR